MSLCLYDRRIWLPRGLRTIGVVFEALSLLLLRCRSALDEEAQYDQRQR